MVYIDRLITSDIIKTIRNFPVTAVIGPRQCGKSTLVKHILKEIPKSTYLDLELPSDLQKLDNPEWFLLSQEEKLICIDEIQRKPELFPLIRSLVDKWNRAGSFLILGSASRDMLKQSSESLAGRISYKRLTPFLLRELDSKYTIEEYFSKGAFPRSLLAKDSSISYEWRESFISTFLERDLLQWSGFTPATMRRLWKMIAHINGQVVNYCALAASLGVSSVTVKSYIDLLESTYMVETVSPYFSNLGKRLVKSSKVYMADSGITATLLELRSFEQMLSHPSFGSIWEQIVLSNVKGWYPNAEVFYYRTAKGAEVDFVIKITNKVFVLECKASYTPVLSKGNYLAIEDISPEYSFVVTPSDESWSMNKYIDVVSLPKLKKLFSEMI
ncbi:MAG: ATP-binding protein [Endomicrobium sp.]|jgi:predicted AAA+ superfamily ATPase|nr:ATP-binding protein [Endomicrobium sp.]